MINKVIYGGNTLIDLTNDTVTPMSLDEGVTAHDASGNIIIGTATRGLPVGFEYFQTNPNIQAGSIPFVGGLWDRTIYSDLWAWVQTQEGYLISEEEWQALAVANNGAVPFYSTGDGSTNFRVPALSVWVKGASSVEEIGSYLSDELKAHKHDVSTDISQNGEHTHTSSSDEQGSHTHTRGTMNITAETHNGDCSPFTYNASTSGALYLSGSKRAMVYNRTNSDSNAFPNAGTLSFDAARSWTGETSENGKHSHTISIGENGNHSHTISVTEKVVGSDETRPKTIVGVYCVIAFGYVSSSGNLSLSDVQDVLEGVQESIRTLGEVATMSIQVNQPSTLTKIWIKPI